MKKENIVFSKIFNDIRLGEFDLGGVMYHRNYFNIYESIREDFFRSINIPYVTLVKKGYHLPLIESHQNFIKPIFYGEEIKVNLNLKDLKRSSFRFDYTFFNSKKTLIHKAYTLHASIKEENNKFKLSSLPKELKDKIINLNDIGKKPVKTF